MLPPEFCNQGPVDYGDLIMKTSEGPERPGKVLSYTFGEKVAGLISIGRS